MGRKALNKKFTEATESAKLRMRFSRQRGPRLLRDVRCFRRGFTRFTNHESQVTCAQLGSPGILDLPNYGGVGNETLVMTARNKDCEDH